MQIVTALTLIIGIQLLVTHVIATALHLYWSIWWMDIMMHLLGGIWLVFAWRTLTDFKYISERYWSLRWVLSVSFGVMVLWEVFGVYVEQGFKTGYVTDTVGDLLCGIVGAGIGFWLLKRMSTFKEFSQN